jgi:2-iminoacetate synthase ThiH
MSEISEERQAMIKSMARKLCIATGHNPDLMVINFIPETITTPIGPVQTYDNPFFPLWHTYTNMAVAMLEISP